MKIHEYADSVPFWIAIDIHGSGLEWQIAFLRTNDLDEREIVYPIAEFDDYWDAEHFSKYDQVPVLFAEETKDVRQNLQCIAYSENLDLDDAKALASELLTEIYPPQPNVEVTGDPLEAACGAGMFVIRLNWASLERAARWIVRWTVLFGLLEIVFLRIAFTAAGIWTKNVFHGIQQTGILLVSADVMLENVE